MPKEVEINVKEEIQRLLRIEFIKPTSVDWISYVISMGKKNGKLRVCVDFKNLNSTTSKGEYPIPIADILIHEAARHQYLSFING